MISNRSIAIGFVIYHSEDTFLDRLKICDDAFFNTYIFDNSPQIDNVRIFCKKLPYCKYFTTGKNVGLGYGISTICAQAYYDFFPAMVFFDQDTIFDVNTLLFIESFCKKKPNLEKEYSSIVFNARRIGDKYFDKFAIKDVLLSISSGSLFYLNTLNKLNWHNQAYFVDCVDYEFCLNSFKHKLKIGECSSTPGFDHVTEQADSAYKLFGKKVMMRKYSLNRVYSTIIGSLKLTFNSLFTLNFRFTKVIFRSILIYIYFQLLVRAISLFKK